MQINNLNPQSRSLKILLTDCSEAICLAGLAGAQKVVFVVYDKVDERKLRAKKQLFELATKRMGHEWHEFDLTAVFPEWMAGDEYREAYFESPEDLDMKLQTEFIDFVADRLCEVLTADGVTASHSVASIWSGFIFSIWQHSVEKNLAPVSIANVLATSPAA